MSSSTKKNAGKAKVSRSERQKLVEQLTEKVWKLWREQMRHERERVGSQRRR